MRPKVLRLDLVPFIVQEVVRDEGHCFIKTFRSKVVLRVTMMVKQIFMKETLEICTKGVKH